MAIYYIDFNASDDSQNGTSKSTPWKRCPGMVGFGGSYSHSAGDTFIFKGGVTWTSSCLPLTIGYSGSSGNYDTYGVDESWYDGGSWSKPTFDAGNTDDYCIYNSAHTYVKIRYLYLTNTSSSVNGTLRFQSSADNNIVEYCYFWIPRNRGVVIKADNNTVRHCEFSQPDPVTSGQTDGMFLQDGSGNTVHDCIFNLYNNSTSHVDCIQTSRETNFTCYNNYCHHHNAQDAQQCILVQENDGINYIYNNVCIGDGQWQLLMYENTGGGGTGTGYAHIYNNLVENLRSTQGECLKTDDTRCLVKNNIFITQNYQCCHYEGGTYPTGNITNNRYYRKSGSDIVWMGSNYTWNEWDNAGYDDGGGSGDPQVDESDEYRLETGSPCIGTGADLSAYFDYDRDNQDRPIGTNWDAGPYEYESEDEQGARIILLIKS